MTSVIHLRHLRASGLCAKGARQWFASHGMSYADFIANGVPASTVESLNDAFADRLIVLARQENDHGG